MKMSDAAKFMVSLSVDIQDGRDRIVALKRQAMWTCRNKQWAGLVEMMALSTVIRNDVYSVYPDASPAMRPLFHGLIKPRIARDASRTCYIMWSRCSSFDNEGVFQPNHFVSLSEVHIEEKRAKTYAQIVAGKQKGEGENMGGKKPHTLFFERKTPFSSPTSLNKGKEQGNSAEDMNRVQNDPEPTSLDKDQEEADLMANEKKVAEQDSFLPTSSPGKGKEQRNSAEDTKEVEGDSESSTTSLDKDQEENLMANEKKVAEQDSFLPTSSPGKGKEQRNSADDTKEVEGDSKSSTTSLDSDQEDLTASEKKVAEQDSFSPASSPGKGKEQGNSAEGMKEVEEDSESSTSSVEKGKTYLHGEQDSESGEGSFGEESPVEYQEQEEQGENGKVGDTRFRKKPSSPSSDPTTASSPPKQSKITPLSPTDVSIKLSLLVTPSLCHQKRKFSKVEQSTSTSASLFKHLTVLTSGNPKNPVHDAGTGDKEKREKGKQSVTEIGTSHDATSPASHQGKNTDSALLPLSVSYRWYMDCGNRESKNRSRADWRASNTMLMDEKGMNLATNRSRVIGRLEENIKVLQEKIDRAKTPKEKTRLLAIKAVGEHLVKNPIMPTQDAGQILAQESQQTIDGVTRRRLSMEIYEILGKHLNVVQIYIREKAFLMENRSSPLLDVVSNVKKIFDSFDVRSQINAHIEEKIGDCYKTALAYLDTKRDQDTLKFLLTKITSINFMAKLQGTSNKRSIQTCTLKVPGMLERFQTVMQELKEKEELSDLAPHEKRGFLRLQKDLIKERRLRHRYKSSVSGRKLKIEE